MRRFRGHSLSTMLQQQPLSCSKRLAVVVEFLHTRQDRILGAYELAGGGAPQSRSMEQSSSYSSEQNEPSMTTTKGCCDSLPLLTKGLSVQSAADFARHHATSVTQQQQQHICEEEHHNNDVYRCCCWYSTLRDALFSPCDAPTTTTDATSASSSSSSSLVCAVDIPTTGRSMGTKSVLCLNWSRLSDMLAAKMASSAGEEHQRARHHQQQQYWALNNTPITSPALLEKLQRHRERRHNSHVKSSCTNAEQQHLILPSDLSSYWVTSHDLQQLKHRFNVVSSSSSSSRGRDYPAASISSGTSSIVGCPQDHGMAFRIHEDVAPHGIHQVPIHSIHAPSNALGEKNTATPTTTIDDYVVPLSAIDPSDVEAFLDTVPLQQRDWQSHPKVQLLDDGGMSNNSSGKKKKKGGLRWKILNGRHIAGEIAAQCEERRKQDTAFHNHHLHAVFGGISAATPGAWIPVPLLRTLGLSLTSSPPPAGGATVETRKKTQQTNAEEAGLLTPAEEQVAICVSPSVAGSSEAAASTGGGWAQTTTVYNLADVLVPIVFV